MNVKCDSSRVRPPRVLNQNKGKYGFHSTPAAGADSGVDGAGVDGAGVLMVLVLMMLVC